VRAACAVIQVITIDPSLSTLMVWVPPLATSRRKNLDESVVRRFLTTHLPN
jgi:hypothetical protein